MKAPPNSGPATEAMPYIAPRRAPYFARLTRGTEHAMMMKLPAKIPAEPIPAMARPTIRAVEFGDAPQMREPISKIMIEVKYDHLRLKNVNNLPQSNWNEQDVRKYAEPYHPTCSIEWNCWVILGMAVEIIVVSLKN